MLDGAAVIQDVTLGLHPTRVGPAVAQFKSECSGRSECTVMHTVNPLVANEMDAKDVWIVSGNRGCKLSDTFNFSKRERIYANGELWLSYTDGNNEEDLFPDDTRVIEINCGGEVFHLITGVKR